MRLIKILSLVLISLGCITLACAQGDTPKKAANDVEMKGEIVDLKCYLGSAYKAQGEKHKECAVMCIKDGLPAGFLVDSTKELYVLVPKAGMSGGNEEMAQYAGESVKLTGMVLKRGTQSMFLYTKIESNK